jgi:hypothetical protein
VRMGLYEGWSIMGGDIETYKCCWRLAIILSCGDGEWSGKGFPRLVTAEVHAHVGVCLDASVPLRTGSTPRGDEPTLFRWSIEHFQHGVAPHSAASPKLLDHEHSWAEDRSESRKVDDFGR